MIIESKFNINWRLQYGKMKIYRSPAKLSLQTFSSFYSSGFSE